MKKFIQAFSLASLLFVLMATAEAQTTKQYRVQIPFDFNIGQESFRAGRYTLSLTSRSQWQQALTIRDEKTNTPRILLALPEEKGKRFATPHLTFKRDGNQNFLVEIAGSGFNIKLPAEHINGAEAPAAAEK
jgi:hypothetical protein